MTEPAVEPPKKFSSTIAGQAFILSFFSPCCPIAALIAFVGGIVGIFRRKRDGRLGFAIAAVVLSFVLWPLFLVPSLPMFLVSQRHARQSECKQVLRALYAAEEARHAQGQPYTAELDSLGTRFDPLGYHELGAVVTGGPVMHRDVAPGRLEPEERAAIGKGVVTALGEVKPNDSEPAVTIVCVGQIDSDPTLDVWSISTAKRTGKYDRAVAPGELYEHGNDTTE